MVGKSWQAWFLPCSGCPRGLSSCCALWTPTCFRRHRWCRSQGHLSPSGAGEVPPIFFFLSSLPLLQTTAIHSFETFTSYYCCAATGGWHLRITLCLLVRNTLVATSNPVHKPLQIQSCSSFPHISGVTHIAKQGLQSFPWPRCWIPKGQSLSIIRHSTTRGSSSL